MDMQLFLAGVSPPSSLSDDDDGGAGEANARPVPPPDDITPVDLHPPPDGVDLRRFAAAPDDLEGVVVPTEYGDNDAGSVGVVPAENDDDDDGGGGGAVGEAVAALALLERASCHAFALASCSALISFLLFLGAGPFASAPAGKAQGEAYFNTVAISKL